jgi:glycerol kinase
MCKLLIQIEYGFLTARLTSPKETNPETIRFNVESHGDEFEFVPAELWSALISATSTTLQASNIKPAEVSEIQIRCQLLVSVFWDDETLGAVRTAIGGSESHEERVARITQSDPQVAGTLAANRLVSGTLVQYLISRMTRGLDTDVPESGIQSDPKAFAGINAQIMI